MCTASTKGSKNLSKIYFIAVIIIMQTQKYKFKKKSHITHQLVGCAVGRPPPLRSALATSFCRRLTQRRLSGTRLPAAIRLRGRASWWFAFWRWRMCLYAVSWRQLSNIYKYWKIDVKTARAADNRWISKGTWDQCVGHIWRSNTLWRHFGMDFLFLLCTCVLVCV